MSVEVLISVVLRASKLQKNTRKSPAIRVAEENPKCLAYPQLRLWKASSAWMGFLLLNQTAAARGACLGGWHLMNSDHLHKNLLMILSWDTQLLPSLAKSLQMTPNLCRIEQMVSVLLCEMEVLPTETTDPSVQSSIFIRAAWHTPAGKAAASRCAQFHRVLSGERGPTTPGRTGQRPSAEGITGESHVWFHIGSLWRLERHRVHKLTVCWLV